VRACILFISSSKIVPLLFYLYFRCFLLCTIAHKFQVVRHKNSPKEVADQQNARAEAKEAESAFKAMNPGQPYHPPPLPQSTYKVAIDVLKIMLSMRAYDPSREQAAAGSPNKGKTTGGGGGGEGIRRNLAIQDLDGETVLHTALILNQVSILDRDNYIYVLYLNK